MAKIPVRWTGESPCAGICYPDTGPDNVRVLYQLPCLRKHGNKIHRSRKNRCNHTARGKLNAASAADLPPALTVAFETFCVYLWEILQNGEETGAIRLGNEATPPDQSQL